MMFLLEALYIILISRCIALTLPGCADNNSTEVDETTNTSSVTCSGISMTATVVWHLSYIPSDQIVNIGQCKPDGYCNIENNNYVISRPNASISHLTFVKSDRSLQNYAVVCSISGTSEGINSCRLDVIYPANVSKCTLNIARNPWQVTGSCEIRNVFSSIGNYLCELYTNSTQSPTESKVNTTMYSPIIHSNINYRAGYCNFTAELPRVEGQYFYRAVVHPGNKEYIFESIIIGKPRRSTNESLTKDFSGHPVNLTFTLLAYPMPNVSAVYFMGHSFNSRDASEIVPYSNILEISCWCSGICKSMCSIRVKNISTETAGYYIITFTNAFGQENVTFQVIMMDNQLSNLLMFLIVAGVVIVAVFFIFVIIVGVKRISKRRKSKADEKVNSTTLAESPVQNANTVKDKHGEKPSIRKGTSSRLRAVYDVVKKRKSIDSYANVLMQKDRKSESDTQSTVKFIQPQNFRVGNTDEMDKTPQEFSKIISKTNKEEAKENIYFELEGSPESENCEGDACRTVNYCHSTQTDKNKFGKDSLGRELFYASVPILEKGLNEQENLSQYTPTNSTKSLVQI